MKTELFRIGNVPAILCGDPSEKCFLFVHGKNGCKEEAADFARMANGYGWQVLGIDLPGYGQRKDELARFQPWEVSAELDEVRHFLHKHFRHLALRANSVGAFFCLMNSDGTDFERSLFVSPVVDMEKLIGNMMKWASVSEERLRNEGEIPTAFGETLSWKYLTYVRSHPIGSWKSPTYILCADRDGLTDMVSFRAFSEKTGAVLSVMENGEHWFHTPEELEVLGKWTEDCLSRK